MELYWIIIILVMLSFTVIFSTINKQNRVLLEKINHVEDQNLRKNDVITNKLAAIDKQYVNSRSEILNQIRDQHKKTNEEVVSTNKKIQALVLEYENRSNVSFDYLKRSIEFVEFNNSERNNILQQKNAEILKHIKENIEIGVKLSASTQTRDSITESYLKEFSERSKSLNLISEIIYKDQELIVELLKAGLLNDLLKDMKKYVLSK